MASAASRFEVEPLQRLLERDRRRGDALAPDTWLGSGEGTQDFSDVFGPFLPAEGAIVRGDGQPRDSRGTFADLVERLEGFAERVGGWAEKGESAAKKVHGFAGSAEKLLDFLGLRELAGAAAKAAAAAGSVEDKAGWVEDKAEVIRRAAETADRWMETLNLRRPPADFRLAAEGEGGSTALATATPRRTRSRGDEVGGKDAPPDGEELLEEVSGRVYDLLMDDLEQAFESR
ncbi:MAG TPA: hypothetical protein VFA79_20490 [Myxococcales bacterium]|nr:hypothetical protein [Myxococcales bacterium]